MDLSQILDELHGELQDLDLAILALEALAQSRPRKRGRPPKSLPRSTATTENQVKGMGGPSVSKGEDLRGI